MIGPQTGPGPAARHRWQRANDGFDTDAKPKALGESHIHHPYQPRGTQLQDRQGASAGQSPEVPDPALDSEQEPPGAGAFKSKSFQEH